MAADIERRSFLAPAHGVVKGRAGGHQRGRGENAVAVRFDDSLIHVAREAEVVGVDNYTSLHLRSEQA